jgi:RNA polymerase sigma-70 factor (ECF subfamily)
MDKIHPLFAAEIPRLRRYARALLRNRDRADDLVQDTLLRGLEKLHLYQPGTNLRAWLFTVMHNLYVNSHRRAARQGQTIHVEKVQLSTPASQVSRLELRDLERAMASLPEDQRTTLLLIGLEGMRYEDVAQICDVPIGTVRSRVSRAREALRHMLKGEDSGSDKRHQEAGGTTYLPVAPKLQPAHDSTTPP